jgi:RNA polymerase sigma-70 factor (ECF subfamily)
MSLTSASLLERVQNGADDDAWRWLVEIYTPLIRGWLRQQAALQAGDAEDLTQEVLAALLQHLPRFEHNHRRGAFRAWLRTLTVNRLRDFWRRQRVRGLAAVADPQALLEAMEDPSSGLSRRWDEEHDRHVAATLLSRVRGEFTATTWEAFQGVALAGRPAAEVGARLGLSANAVLIAKSRVLRRLRQEGRGLIDEGFS